MTNKIFAMFVLSAAAIFAARSLADDMSGMPMPASSPPATQPTTQPFGAQDVRNTICPVSGDTVLTSSLVEVYDGKVYHLCCADCHTDFEKNPEKYAKLVADNPAKYGVK
jgi:YHS domain-containing protein